MLEHAAMKTVFPSLTAKSAGRLVHFHLILPRKFSSCLFITQLSFSSCMSDPSNPGGGSTQSVVMSYLKERKGRFILKGKDYSGIDSITKWIRQFNSEADIREQHIVKQK
ncbi:hypothetical protein AV530_011781 [Patagioenas fasciata monilis]|uniref:Uncharacterized protein n=1 Tax=Patagioenas fasciata monilis TaxID=372326 RepID=A0A1V4KLS2_PATFA|nr:hypothetical protein AV530_011781 [Patagioenas fasciata monilis]